MGRIFVIGAGAMAESFIRGVLHHPSVQPSDVSVVNRVRADRLLHLVESHNVRAAKSLSEAEGAEVIILAVKPHDVFAALKNLTPYLHGQTIISFAAGVTIASMNRATQGRAQVIRTMPNVPVAVLEGAIAMAVSHGVDIERVQQAKQLLSELGLVIELEESMMDAATAFSGSGPGFVSYFLEAMEEAAVALGFSAEMARSLLIQTVVGTARVLEEWRLSPSELRERVTSPNGTTHAGVTVMEQYRMREVIGEALQAAANRSREMGAAGQDGARD